MGYIKLAVFDFDGTLFRSPEKPTWWEGGWWGNLNSLNEPCVPERPSNDWWNGSVVSAAKQAISNPDVMAILLTGRIQKFSLRLKDLLGQAGLKFDQVHLSSGGATESFKIKVIKDILDKNPAIRGVAIWEDRSNHLKMMADWIEANGRACTPHLITVAVHESECQPSAKKVALALRVAAKYKDKTEDAEGNVHYEYSDRQLANRDKEKAKRVEKLRKSISDLRAKVRKDLNSKDAKTRLSALAVALMDETLERIGNHESAEDGHFGVTGWRKSHLTFKGDTTTLKYVGKSGVKHEKTVEKASLVSALKKLVTGKSDEDCVFSDEDTSLDPEDVNEYLKDFDVTAKDIRGYRANDEMCKALSAERAKGPKELPRARKEKDEILKAEFTRALEKVADIVGHGSTMLRSQYLVPDLEPTYMKDGEVLESLNPKTASRARVASQALARYGHKLATKTTSEKEDEAVDALIKPSPKKKPPRKDLKKRRVDLGDPDLDTTDDDLSRNYKKVAVRVAMAVRVADRFAAKTKQEYVDQKAKEKAEADKKPSSHKQKSDEARTERTLSKKKDKLFDDYIKGKSFTNPETKKKVQFGSLPKEEQVKVREKLREGWDKKQEAIEEKANADKEDAEEKADKDKETAEAEDEAVEDLAEDEKSTAKSEAEKKKHTETENLKEVRSQLREKAKSLGNVPAFDEDMVDDIGEVFDSLLSSMNEADSTKLIEGVVASRDAGIASLSKGRPSSSRVPPTKEKIDKLKSKLDDLSEAVDEHTEKIEDLEGELEENAEEIGELDKLIKKHAEGKELPRGEDIATVKAKKTKLERAKVRFETEKSGVTAKLETAKKKQDTAHQELKADFTEYYTHEALKTAERNPMTFIDNSQPLDKKTAKDRSTANIERFSDLTSEDREKTSENFHRELNTSEDRIEALEDMLASTDSGSSKDREANLKELKSLRNKVEYLDHDLRALEISSVISGDETKDRMSEGTRSLIKALHTSGVDISQIVDSGLGQIDAESDPKELSDLIRQVSPSVLEGALDEIDPSGRMSKIWSSSLGADDDDEGGSYIWPFSKIKDKSDRNRAETAHSLFVDMLTNVAVKDSRHDNKIKKTPTLSPSKEDSKGSPSSEVTDEEMDALEREIHHPENVDIDLDIKNPTPKTAAARVASRFYRASCRNLR